MNCLRYYVLMAQVISAIVVRAQQPFASIGKTTDVLTLSSGQYPEIFANDTLQTIGRFRYNTVTGRAYRCAGTMRVHEELEGALGSGAFESNAQELRVGRFLSLDPLMATYPFNSPYAFSENRVIDAIEVEGLESFEIRNHPTKTDTRILLMRDPNASFAVFDEDDTELRHFKYSGFQSQMKDYYMAPSREPGGSAVLVTPNLEQGRGQWPKKEFEKPFETFKLTTKDLTETKLSPVANGRTEYYGSFSSEEISFRGLIDKSSTIDGWVLPSYDGIRLYGKGVDRGILESTLEREGFNVSNVSWSDTPISPLMTEDENVLQVQFERYE